MTKKTVVPSAALFVSLFLAWAPTASAKNPNSLVFAPNSTPFGMSYGEWSAEWWKWLISIPAKNSPVLDADGGDCAEGQSGPVWYLAGTFGGAVTRTCSVPASKLIMFPILNAVCYRVGPGAFDEGTEQELRDCAKNSMDHATVVDASIDGVALHSLNPPNSPFRTQSGGFEFSVPPNNILGLPPGGPFSSGQAVSDGYWIMTASLPLGPHTIHFHGRIDIPATDTEPPFEFETEATYLLDIVQD